MDEFLGLGDDGAAFGRAGDGDSAAAAELEQALVAELSESAQDRVRVHVEYGGDVLGGREPLARLGFSVCNRPADLGRDLLVQIDGLVSSTLTLSMVQRYQRLASEVPLPVTVTRSRPRELDEIEQIEALIEEARRARRRRFRRGAFGVVLAFVGGFLALSRAGDDAPVEDLRPRALMR